MTARQDVERGDGSTDGLRHLVVLERGDENVVDKYRKPAGEGVGLSCATRADAIS